MRLHTFDAGSTMLEVLIASVILALAGSAIVGGFVVSRTVQSRNLAKSTFLGQFQEAVQEVTQRPYANCLSGTNTNPYPTPAPLNPTITVEVMTGTNLDQTSPCTSTNVGVVQLVTISKQYGNDTISQQLVKTP